MRKIPIYDGDGLVSAKDFESLRSLQIDHDPARFEHRLLLLPSRGRMRGTKNIQLCRHTASASLSESRTRHEDSRHSLQPSLVGGVESVVDRAVEIQQPDEDTPFQQRDDKF